MNLNTFFALILPLLMSTTKCFADNLGLFPKTYISVQESIYSGDKNISFSEGSPGYGLELTVLNEGRTLAPFFSSSISMINSRQSFLDSTTSVSAGFLYYGAEAEAGLIFFPISRRNKGFNAFLSGAGIVGYNFLSIDKNVSLTNIPHNDQSFSAGYSAGLGAEWIVSTDSSRKWTLFSKIEYKSASATLLKKTFSINRGCLSVGIGW
ncbi:MAG: hypothetical protein KF865_11290 [Bdellovibrionaceae bacterium]|nr:hypothetical protein [Pseudobdellovibrionaceae bacterium]